MAGAVERVASGDYAAFLAGKRRAHVQAGFHVEDLHHELLGFQRDIVAWALRLGRAAIFSDCGTGKTIMQLEWARRVHEETGGDVLILAPLAVSEQTQREGSKFEIPVTLCRRGEDVRPGVNVTNYEMLHAFDAGSFAGVVLDESSILRNYTGKTRNAIIGSFARTPYRLAATATPSPNDYMELGNHAEFLGAMTRTEMLSMFFVHDGGETQKWRLKGHATGPFWEWLASWAVMLRKPSDLGYDDAGFDLPPLRYVEHIVSCDLSGTGLLFDCESPSLMERRRLRRASMAERVAKAVDLARDSSKQWLLWCDLNDESGALASAIDDAVEVRGTDSQDEKRERLLGFAEGRYRVLVTKTSIAGHGMNWQNCARMAFVGLSDSYEALYQSVRRCWRFGQEREVEAHIITSEGEGAVLHNVRRKEADAEHMAENVVRAMKRIQSENVRGAGEVRSTFAKAVERGDGWEVRLGDCVEEMRAMEEGSIDYTVFSPPFASLYTYTDLDRDMGNCADDGEFVEHFAFLVPELLRVTKPGRLLSFHCMNLPSSKARDGYIGLKDFRGQLIRTFVDAGWIYHSEVCIWKDPVTSMQRTKALGLLHKQIRKDSCLSRMGIPDYVVTVRKPGENPEPVSHTHDDFPVSLWQKWASPVWDDINPSDTLQRTSAREEADERHIAPLQLEVIRRCLVLWSNPGDLVMSPFAGIGSEGFEALRCGRRFLGIELKRSYWEQAVANLRRAEAESAQAILFDAAQS